MSTQPFRPDEDQPLATGPQDGQPIPGSSFTRDTSPPLDVATFDLGAWVRGVRPTRRTVKLYLRSDLLGALDELGDRIESAGDTVNVDADVDEFERLRQEYLADFTYWTVEGRSSEWVSKCWDESVKAHRITLDRAGNARNDTDKVTLLLDQLAGQVVEVKTPDGQVQQGVSAEVLRELFNGNERELNKLAYAMADCNQNPGDRATVLTKDFSQRSSTARSGTAS